MIMTFIPSNIQAKHFLLKCPRKITLLCFLHHGKNIATYNTQDERVHIYRVTVITVKLNQLGNVLVFFGVTKIIVYSHKGKVTLRTEQLNVIKTLEQSSRTSSSILVCHSYCFQTSCRCHTYLNVT